MSSGSKGFTLIEIVVAAAIVGILVLIVSTLVNIVSMRYYETWGRLEAELAASRAENILRNYFSQAVDISNVSPALGGAAVVLAGTLGQVRPVLFDQIADPGADWSSLAAFVREDSSGRGTNAYGGDLRRTAMWFRRPSFNTSGVLFFRTWNDALPASPSYNDPYIDRISLLEIRRNVMPFVAKAASLDFRIHIRYHTNHVNGFNWCPQADILIGANGCNPNPARLAATRDFEKNFRIVLQNNLIKTAVVTQHSPTSQEERMFGGLYFFRMLIPASWD